MLQKKKDKKTVELTSVHVTPDDMAYAWDVRKFVIRSSDGGIVI